MCLSPCFFYVSRNKPPTNAHEFIILQLAHLHVSALTRHHQDITVTEYQVFYKSVCLVYSHYLHEWDKDCVFPV